MCPCSVLQMGCVLEANPRFDVHIPIMQVQHKTAVIEGLGAKEALLKQQLEDMTEQRDTSQKASLVQSKYFSDCI